MGIRNNGNSMNNFNNGVPNNMQNGGLPNNMPQGNGMPKPGKTPKVKKEKLQNVSKFSHSRNVIFIILLVCASFIIFNFWSTMQLKETVEIVTLKSSVVQDGLITDDNMQKVEITSWDYDKLGVESYGDGGERRHIVLWKDKDTLVNKYASYYIRENAPIYWDAIGTDSSKQYSYLYKMDGELLKITLDADTFGQMLVPGDHINVRAAYNEPVYTLPSSEELKLQQQTGITPQNSIPKQILLFNNCAVLDILNSSGESVYDMYYELLALPKDEQAEIINSEDFQSKVQPSEILLNVTPEEADRYMSIQNLGPTYMMTLLPRTSSNPITEVLNELATGFARTGE